jgi:hypothetical protein
MAFAANDPKTLFMTVRDTDSDNKRNETTFEQGFGSIFNFPEEFHEMRFDFLPDRIDFYIGDLLILTESKAVPDTAGTLSLRHYVEDGREEPPAHDAVMTVAYVKAYYNTTANGEPLETCYDVKDCVCVVPDQRTQPNPDGEKTHFYSPVAGEDEDERDDEVGISHAGYLQPDGPKNVAGAASIWSGALFASGLLLVAVIRFL